VSTIHSPRFSIKGIREHEDAHHPTSGINVGEVERWASAIGGTLLVAHGLRRGSFGGLALALIGGGLVYRGVTGHCEVYQALNIDTSDKHPASDTGHIHEGVLVEHSVTIDRPARELYAFWHDVENAPRFMSQVRSVRKDAEGRTHWVATGPLGRTYEWDSEIINDEPGRLIAWKSLPGADLDHAGSVRFEPAPDGRGTVVTLEMNYEPIAGALGLTVAKILGQDPDQIASENLGDFKRLMEAGDLPGA
jgi:uncharacterized membrane protein